MKKISAISKTPVNYRYRSIINREAISQIVEQYFQLNAFCSLSTKNKDVYDRMTTNFITQLKNIVFNQEFHLFQEKNSVLLFEQIEDLLMDATEKLKDASNNSTAFNNMKKAITEISFNFLTNFAETIDRVYANLSNIKAMFNGNPQTIVDLEILQSDSHNAGRRVAKIVFQDDSQIIYKPRDIRPDSQIVGAQFNSNQANSISEIVNRAFKNSSFATRLKETLPILIAQIDFKLQKMITQANKNLLIIKDLPTYKFLSCFDGTHHYGFVEYLSYTKADYILNSQDDVRVFYRQAGRIGAIARIFGITDLHQENIMVHNKQPHLIDLEFTYDYQTFAGHIGTLLGQGLLYPTGGESQKTKNIPQLFASDVKPENYLGDILLGFIEGVTAIRMVDLAPIYSNIPQLSRIRCALVRTALLKGWIISAIFNEQTCKQTLENNLFTAMQQPYVFNKNQIELFEEGIMWDMIGADIPIFYQKTSNHEIVYDHRRQGQELSIFTCKDNTSTNNFIEKWRQDVNIVSVFLNKDISEIVRAAFLKKQQHSCCDCQ